MEHDDALKDYNDALARLIKNVPTRVPKGAKITNDAVSLEAGRGKGSIKKSRAGYADLIARINEASEAQRNPKREATDKVNRLNEKIKTLEDKVNKNVEN